MTFGMSYDRALQMAAAVFGAKSVLIKTMQVFWAHPPHVHAFQ